MTKLGPIMALGVAWLLASGSAWSDSHAATQEGQEAERAEAVADTVPRVKLAPSGGLEDAPPEAIAKNGKPVFVPPNRGTPVARVGGAARAMGRLPGIEALVPLESGLTLQPQPVLYWYLSEPTDLPVNFTLIDLDVEAPLIDMTLSGPFEQGVHEIRLSEHAARLSQGKLYQWFVAIVPDPNDRSSDRLAGGGIELVETKLWLQERLRSAAPDEVPSILAGAGVWYDALQVLSERIEERPEDPVPLAQRTALFEQVGLQAVVAD